MGNHIFFSYSRKDATIARKLVQLLRGQEIEVWQDVSAIEGGQDYMNRIFNDISTASALVLLWSAQSKDSKWVEDEINHALADRKPVIPLCIDGTPLPNSLKTRQHIQIDPADPQKMLDVILKTIPAEAWAQWRAYKENLPWWQQASPSATPIPGTDLLQVYVRESWCCDVYAVGTVGAFSQPPNQLVLCLQFSGQQSMVPQVYHDLKPLQTKNVSGEFAALYFVSRFQNDRGFTLREDDPAQWQASLKAIERTVPKLAVRGTTTLQLCVQAPGALMAGFGRILDRFWSLEIYHFVLPKGPYVHVLNVD